MGIQNVFFLRKVEMSHSLCEFSSGFFIAYMHFFFLVNYLPFKVMYFMLSF